MRRSDRNLYQVILQRLPLPELTALYERTLPEYPVLAEAIETEIDSRLSGEPAVPNESLTEASFIPSFQS